MKKITAILVFGCILLSTACFLAGNAARTPATPFPQPTTAPTMVVPTSSSQGDAITWNNLQVTMDQPEFTQVYETDYGSTRVPPTGGKFL